MAAAASNHDRRGDGRGAGRRPRPRERRDAVPVCRPGGRGRPAARHAGRARMSDADRHRPRHAGQARRRRHSATGAFVNLGIGLPTKVSNFLAPGSGVTPAHRERHARDGARGGRRPGRPRPDQRRQDRGDRAARRLVLPPRRLVRDDARRPPRRLRARGLPGVGARRPGQLAHRQAPTTSPPSAARWTSRSAPSRPS